MDLDGKTLDPELARLVASDAEEEAFVRVLTGWLKRIAWLDDVHLLNVEARVSGSGTGLHLQVEKAWRDDVDGPRYLNGREVMQMRRAFHDDEKRWNLDLDRARQNVHYLGGNLWDLKGPNEHEQHGNRHQHPGKRVGPWVMVADQM